MPGHRGYAGETLELAHPLDGRLRVYRGNTLPLALPLPLAEYAGSPPDSYHHGSEKKNTDAAHLQSLRPPPL